MVGYRTAIHSSILEDQEREELVTCEIHFGLFSNRKEPRACRQRRPLLTQLATRPLSHRPCTLMHTPRPHCFADSFRASNGHALADLLHGLLRRRGLPFHLRHD